MKNFVKCTKINIEIGRQADFRRQWTWSPCTQNFSNMDVLIQIEPLIPLHLCVLHMFKRGVEVTPVRLLILITALIALTSQLLIRRVAITTMATSSSSSSTNNSVVLVTVPSHEVATKLAHHLVGAKLAACVNVIPSVESVYEWEGKIESDKELLLMIKTKSELVSKIVDDVNTNHPYDLPEVISLKIDDGSKAYLDWIAKATKTD